MSFFRDAYGFFVRGSRTGLIINEHRYLGPADDAEGHGILCLTGQIVAMGTQVKNMLLKAVAVSRPIFWLIAPAAYLFGAYSGGTMFGPLVYFQAFLLSIPLGIYVFGLNDLYDIESDRANPRRKGEMWGARIEEKDRGGIIAASIVVVALILLSAIANGQIIHIITVLAFLPFPFLYSVPPFRLKSRPLIDSLTNATYTFGPYAMGYSLSGGFGYLNLPMILLSLVFSAAHAIGTIMDLPGDSKAGIRTFASVLGSRTAAAFAVLLLALNIPFVFDTMKSFFLVLVVYLLSSVAVLIWPKPEVAKNAFVAMNISFMIWIAYAGIGMLTGFWPVL